MKLLYAKSAWEAPRLTLPDFLDKAARDGFDAAEVYLPGRSEPPAEIRRLCAAAGLKPVLQIATEGDALSLDAALPIWPIAVEVDAGGNRSPFSAPVAVRTWVEDRGP